MRHRQRYAYVGSDYRHSGFILSRLRRPTIRPICVDQMFEAGQNGDVDVPKLDIQLYGLPCVPSFFVWHSFFY